MLDRTLKDNVESELVWDPKVDAAHIGISVNDGALTLIGRTNPSALLVA